jgi:hypothetical protein
MAASTIPMGFQEPATSQRGLNIACMATPYLFIFGFSTAFSAIFTKAWRIRIVVQEAINMHHTTVSPSDVLLPFLMLMMTNVMLLAAWTVESPLVWTRVPVGTFDAFGRSVESVGQCIGREDEDGVDLTPLFASFLALINIIVLVVAFHQAYLTRRLPSQFNEAKRVDTLRGNHSGSCRPRYSDPLRGRW